MALSSRLRTAAELLMALAEAFEQSGRHAFLVGGSVRDEMLGRPQRDVDLTTDATPEETRAIVARTRPAGVYDVGARFGTIGAVYELDGERLPVEITTFRAEAYQAGSRKPQVAYGVSLLDDLARRDFTINAMARELRTGQLVDPHEGRADLDARLIRTVGDPVERFGEDPLRMLRAVRFSVELGFRIDEATAAAIGECAGDLCSISRERVAEEMNRVLLSPEPARGLRALADLGLMRGIVPELLPLRDAAQGGRAKDVFEHTLRVVEHTEPGLPLRWAALLHDVGKPRTLVVDDGEVHYPGHERVGESMARRVLTNLRLDNDTTERVARLVGMHMRANQYEPEWTDGAVRRLMREAGDELERLLQLSAADVTSYRPQKIEAARARVDALRARVEKIAEQEEVAALHSPLDGDELMKMFDRRPGPWIRDVKDYLLGLVLDGDLGMDDKARAAELARAFVGSLGS